MFFVPLDTKKYPQLINFGIAFRLDGKRMLSSNKNLIQSGYINTQAVYGQKYKVLREILL